MLRSTATPFPAGSTCSTATCGSGIANAAAAVALAKGGGGPTPPGAFGKTSPGNLASVPGTSVTLQWSASAGAASYAYCIDTTNDSACSTSWVGAGAATSASVSGLSPGATYYWQVRASNAGGDTTADAGAWRTFVTQTASLPGSFEQDLAEERPEEPVDNRDPHLAGERGRGLVRVVRFVRERILRRMDVHDCDDDDRLRPQNPFDLLLAGASRERQRPEGRHGGWWSLRTR